MARLAAAPLTDAACALASDGWLLNKGSSWWDGNYQNTLYNHYLIPMPAGQIALSITTPVGRPRGAFIPAASNVLYCDGHVVFVKDSVNPLVWQAIATRAGGEVVSADSL